MSHIKYLLLLMLLFVGGIKTYANDSSYYTSGNHLVPLEETRISIKKEILTIELSDDGFATVIVEYTFYNPDGDRVIQMGFEAEPPYYGRFSPEGKHPDILDFTGNLNGKLLAYRTSVVYDGTMEEIKDLDTYLTPEECEEYMGTCRYDIVGRKDSDDVIVFAYAYYFEGLFKHGENHLRHTYRYRLAEGVSFNYHLSYLLSPAMRWANHQIDDFTLRISTPNTAKHFIIFADPFEDVPFEIVSGAGKFRRTTFGSFDKTDCIEVSLRNGVIQWHKNDFVAKSELKLYSAEYAFSYKENHAKRLNGEFYDRRGKPYFNIQNLSPFQKRIWRNMPFASRGYIFKTPELNEYFNNLWWYIPDPDAVDSTEDFTDAEKELLRILDDHQSE